MSGPTGPLTPASPIPPRRSQRTTPSGWRSTEAVSEPATRGAPGRAARAAASAPTPFWTVSSGVVGPDGEVGQHVAERHHADGADHEVGWSAGHVGEPGRRCVTGALRRVPAGSITTAVPAAVAGVPRRMTVTSAPPCGQGPGQQAADGARADDHDAHGQAPPGAAATGAAA